MAVIGILKEHFPERRVALLPEECATLVKMKTKVLLEDKAGEGAWVSSGDYQNAGVQVVPRAEVLKADLILGINPLQPDEIGLLKDGQILVGTLSPFINKDFV